MCRYANVLDLTVVMGFMCYGYAPHWHMSTLANQHITS
jgi:hypothetical protein